MWDNSNMQEDIHWGNIPVGNLSDEELYKKNWNHHEGIKNYWNSEEGKKQKKQYSEMAKSANKQRLSDPEYRKKIAETSRKVAQDPLRNEKLSQSQKKYWNSEDGIKKRSEVSKENWINNRDSMTKGLKERYADGKLADKISNSLKNSIKLKEATAKQTNQIQTPDGVFPSRKAAAEFYKIHPTAVNRRIKSHPDQYYYITIGNGSTGYKNKKK
jgi:hypothetical protein